MDRKWVHKPYLLFSFLVFTIIFSFITNVNATCFTNPISINNISYCENGNCYYTQFTSGSSDIKTGNSICYEYSDNILTPDSSYVNFTIGDATASFGYTDCYYTDDFVGIGSCHCNCPLSFNDADVCPCPNAVHYDNFESICKSGQVAATGCPFGRLTDACCNIHFSAYSRYQVCSINKFPSYTINLRVETAQDVSCEFIINNNQQNLHCLNVNLTISNININDIQIPNFRILDTLTGKSYFSSHPKINTKNEKDPTKFGAITVNEDNSLNIPPTFVNFINIESTDCSHDSIDLTFPTPLLSDVLPAATRSTGAPILKSGLMYIDMLDIVQYVGKDFNNRIIIGPKISEVLVREQDLYFNINQPTQSCSQSGFDDFSAHLPNIPSNKTYLIKFWSNLLDETQNAPMLGLIEFSSALRFLMKFTPHPVKGYVVYGCNDNVSGKNMLMSVNLYPTNEPYTVDITDTILDRPLLNVQNTRNVLPPSFDKEITSGSLIYNFYFNGINLRVHNTKVKITVTDIFLDGNTISFNSYLDQDNILCQAITTPQLTDSKSFRLSKIPQLINLSVHDVTYKGLANITLNCGVDTSTTVISVDLHAKPENKIPEQLLLSNWNNNQWYVKYIKIGVIIIPSLVLLYIIYKLFSCIRRKGKKPIVRYVRRA